MSVYWAILSVFLLVFALRLYFELAVFAMSTDWETVWFEQRLKVVGLANSFWSVLKSGTHIDFSPFHNCVKLQTTFIALLQRFLII